MKNYLSREFFDSMKQFLRKMRTTCILLIVFASSLFATNVNSQVAKVNLAIKSASVIQIIREIENQTDYLFVFDKNEIDLTRKVDIDEGTHSVDEVLAGIFNHTNVVYAMEGANIILMSRNPVQQQIQKSVTGKVTDSSGAPMPGVTVLVKGTNQGIITDTNGTYSLDKVPGDATLVFSFVGMKTQEIPVKGKTSVNVQMDEDAIGIEEVVAVGYGTVKRSDLTGSVSSVKSETLEKIQLTSIDAALQGQAPGIQVVQTTGAPGGGFQVRVRGVSSINAGNDPLWVIDGFPIDNSAGGLMPAANANYGRVENVQNPLAMINPNDIESIEVLKDASATAVYGSRGANGVILITTKRGKAGKLKVNLQTSLGVSNFINLPEVLNTSDFLDYADMIAEGYGPNFTSLRDYYADKYWFDDSRTYNYLDMVTQTGITQNYFLSASGGNENNTFSVSLGYYDQQGIIKNTGYERYSARFASDHKVNDRLTLGLNILYSQSNQDVTQTSGGTAEGDGGYTTGVIDNALYLWPFIPMYDDQGRGEYFDVGENLVGGKGDYSFETGGLNPVALVNLYKNATLSDRVLTNGHVDFKILEGLTFKQSIGVDVENALRHEFYPSTIADQSSEDYRYGGQDQARKTNKVAESLLNFDKSFGSHNLNVTGVYSWQRQEYNYFIASGTLSDDLTAAYDLGKIPLDRRSLGSQHTSWKLISLTGRLNYNYNGKYYFTFTGRRDGSSKFGANNKWGFFPSGALSWRVSEENFLKNNDLVSNLKLRFSYGVVGNQEIGVYKSLGSLNTFANYNAYGNLLIGTTEYLGNADLRWEKTTTKNIGVDLSLWEGRLGFTLDVYDMKTTDLLFNASVLASSGVSSMLQNVGVVSNKGFDLGINANVIRNSEFSWAIDANVSHYKNEIEELADGQTNIDELWVGQPIGVIRTYDTYGVIHNQAELDEYTSTISNGSVFAIGGLKIRDTNGKDENGNLTGKPDGKIDSDDQIFAGSPHPDFYYGINNIFKYRNFELSFYINGTYGNEKTHSLFPHFFSGSNVARVYNIPKEYYGKSFTGSNQDSEWPKLGYAQTSYDAGSGTYGIFDASYIRLKNVQLAYNLSPKLFRNFKGGQIYISGANLLTITKYKLSDPEITVEKGTPLSSGNSYSTNISIHDKGGYPFSRTWTFGVKLNF